MDSYAIVLVLTLSTTQKLLEASFKQPSFLGRVENSNGSFRPCEGPGLARISGLLVDAWPEDVGQMDFFVDFAYQPLRSCQHSPVTLCLDFYHVLLPF